jgi:hypothetical protein
MYPFGTPSADALLLDPSQAWKLTQLLEDHSQKLAKPVQSEFSQKRTPSGASTKGAMLVI